MQLITDDIRAQLLRNGATPDNDPFPVCKLFNPAGAATWLISEMDPQDEDQLFGLCDLGFGTPELGYVSLKELESITVLPGLGIERDIYWAARHPLSVYARVAQRYGRIVDAPGEEDVGS